MRQTRALAPLGQRPWSALSRFRAAPICENKRLHSKKRRNNRGYQHRLVKSGQRYKSPISASDFPDLCYSGLGSPKTPRAKRGGHRLPGRLLRSRRGSVLGATRRVASHVQGRRRQPPRASWTIIIDTKNRSLHLVQPNHRAIRYGIGVGRHGFRWSGRERISRMEKWPDWRPPLGILGRQPIGPVS
jgi:hypothetical protein